MAIYHFSAQVISRSSGRSATAAAAYRAGEKNCGYAHWLKSMTIREKRSR